MLMTIALILLALLAVGVSLMWRNRLNKMAPLFAAFEEQFDVEEVDISGNKKYTNCMSHDWVMRNVVRGDYSKSGESLSDFVGENTVVGTMLVGIAMGMGPVLLVLVMFQSFVVAGASLVTVLVAAFIVRPSGEVGVSYDMLSFLAEQEPSKFKMGDWAYAVISSNRIKKWSTILLLIALASFVLAPVGDLLPDAAGLGIALYFAIFMERIYLPLAAISFPLALISFIVGIPLLPLIVFALFRMIRNRLMTQSEMDGV
ncbi:MAG: hypothetical protein ACFFD6_02105 [Candidatus Thorarchaeota archaeon]